MVNYSINDNEIIINFSNRPDNDTLSRIKSTGMSWDRTRKVWKGSYNEGRENLAKELVNTEARHCDDGAVQICDIDTDLDKIVSDAITDGELGDEMKQAVYAHMSSNPDSVIDLINKYKADVKAIESEKSKYEEVRKTLAEKMKYVADKKDALECLAAAYLESNNLDNSKGTEYNMVLSTSQSMELSEKFVTELIASLNLPSWLKIEIKLNKTALKELGYIPDGVNLLVDRKLKLKKNLGDSSRESLRLFIEGLSIRNISTMRNLKWTTIRDHLTEAMSKGELNLLDYISQETLNDIMAYHECNPTITTIADYANAFRGKVSYDIMALALKYLNLR